MLWRYSILLRIILASYVTAQLISSDISGTTNGRLLDLNYARYQGYVAPDSGLEYFLGIRYAARPKRWQAPVKPKKDRGKVIQANVYGERCYQSRSAVSQTGPADLTGSEDCLFLNVWTPTNATTKLPVLVWFHGGGYGGGDGRADPTFLQQITGQRFVFVSVQYRLGAFGFLASEDVKSHGVLNAGLLDQNFALKWIQEHIATFGGDPSSVTIFGESAGAGGVMQQLLSYGGSINTTLFKNAILASPYLPKQHDYDAAVPTQFYDALAAAVGCNTTTYRIRKFSCLSSAKSTVLANASDYVSTLAFYGNWAFAPVTDGHFLQKVPSEQLMLGHINGNGLLVGNNAFEGNTFTPQDVNTSEQFMSFVKSYLPNLNTAGMERLLTYYPEPLLTNNLYLNQFERTARFVADAQFVCPGEWLADATDTSYRYQYSIPTSYHGLDLSSYLPNTAPAGAISTGLNEFASIVDVALTSFMATGEPNISTTGKSFPLWNTPNYGSQVNFNISDATTVPYEYGGYPIDLAVSGAPNISIESGIQMTNGLRRCDFWRSIAAVVPM